jgi:tol-pal system protein YbgF
VILVKTTIVYLSMGFLILSLLAGCATHRDVLRLEEQLAASEQREEALKERVAALDSTVTEQSNLLYSIRAELRTGLESVAGSMEAVSEVVKYGEREEYTPGPLVVESPGAPGQELLEDLTREEAEELTGEGASAAIPVVVEGDLTASGQPSEGRSEEAVESGKAPKRAIYDTAYLDMVRGNYDLAMQGFREFLQTGSENELKDNAQYWIGECFYAERNHDEAIAAFQRVVDEYPRGNKVPAALFKIGKCYYELNDPEEASRYFQSVIGGYPHSEESKLAREYLSDLR